MAEVAGSLAQSHVRYSEIRDSIQTGDLLAWRVTRASSIFDYILMVYQIVFKAKISHTAVALRVGNRVFAVEATPPHVRVIPLSMLGNFYIVHAGIEPSARHFDVLVEDVGKKYGLLDLAKAYFRRKMTDAELFCSEQCLKFYLAVGYFEKDVDEFDDRIPTPDDILERVLKESGNEIMYVRIDKGNLNEL